MLGRCRCIARAHSPLRAGHGFSGAPAVAGAVGHWGFGGKGANPSRAALGQVQAHLQERKQPCVKHLPGTPKDASANACEGGGITLFVKGTVIKLALSALSVNSGLHTPAPW